MSYVEMSATECLNSKSGLPIHPSCSNATNTTAGLPDFPILIVLPLSTLFHLFVVLVTFKLMDSNAIRGPRPNVEDKHIFLAAAQISRVPYSLIVSGFVVYSMVKDYESMLSNFIGWRTFTAETTALFTIGFHISDILLIVVGDYVYGLRHITFLLHHLLMFFLYSVIHITGKCYAYGIAFLIVEIIVPFITVQATSVGLRLRFSESKLFHLNNAFLIHLFHMRHGFEFLLGLLIYWNRRHIENGLLDLSIIVCVTCHLVPMFAFITPYWTFHFTLNTFKIALGQDTEILMKNGVKRD